MPAPDPCKKTTQRMARRSIFVTVAILASLVLPGSAAAAGKLDPTLAARAQASRGTSRVIITTTTGGPADVAIAAIGGTAGRFLRAVGGQVALVPDGALAQLALRDDVRSVAVDRPVSGADLVQFQRLVRRVPVADSVLRYALSLVRTSRPKAKNAPDQVKKWVAFGCSVRAAQYLVLGAKARAAMDGRPQADLDDVRSVATAVLRHRVMTNFAAEAADRTSEDVVQELVSSDGWWK